MQRQYARAIIGLLAGLCCGLAAAQSPAAPQAASEQALKAVLLFKLPLFVYEPPLERAPSPLLCQLGRSGLEDALAQLQRSTTDGRTVSVRYLDDAVQAAPCDMVFIGSSERHRLDTILPQLARRPQVTVSDIEGFARSGGMVELVVRTEGTGIDIVINRRVAHERGVSFAAQLLRLARLLED
jgi:hypothetical protein